MSHYEASVEHSFTARHSLPLPGGGREEPHRHTWRVTATFRSDRLTGDMGVVVDFLDVRRALERICNELNGADLNEVQAFSDGKPSAERVAEHIASAMAGCDDIGRLLVRLEVTEAPGCRAAFYT